MQDLFFVLFASFVLMFAYNVYCFQRSISFLKKGFILTKKNFVARVDSGRRCFVFIPVYLEQDKIVNTICYFEKISAGLPVEIIIVTTNKESSTPSTRDIVHKHLENSRSVQVRCIHYPEKDGYMAHQLNYAFEQLIKGKFATLNDFFVVYNADSHPHPDTFRWFFSITPTPDVIQQVAILYKNFDEMPQSFGGYLSMSFATLQTRWSLTHELPRIISNASKSGLFSSLKNANCIGHGLFIKGTILKDNNLFSEETMTEDLFLGFLLRANKVTIEPHQFMELAESPTGVLTNIKQRIVWSWGSIMYPYYFISFVSRIEKKSFRKIARAFILMIQGVFSWIRWIFSGVSIFFIASYPFFADVDNNLFIYSVIALLLYGFIQYFTTLLFYPFLVFVSSGTKKKRLPVMQIIIVAMFSYVVILLHSIAGIIGMFQYTRYLITGIMPKKYKTGENVL